MTRWSARAFQKVPAGSYRGILAAVCFVAMTAATSSLQAVPITTPPDLNPGDPYRLAFVTTSLSGGQFNTISTYNMVVTVTAGDVPALAALGTTWTAIASTPGVDARDNTATNPVSTGVPIYLLDGTRIADNNADLWDGSLLATFSIDQTGAFFGAPIVWTGTAADGTGLDVLGGGGAPTTGSNAEVNSGWVQFNTPPAKNVKYPLYAISGVLTAVPEPPAALLACLGAASFGLGALSRRYGHWRGRRLQAALAQKPLNHKTARSAAARAIATAASM